MIKIYAYQNKINDKIYIGQSSDLARRLWNHVNKPDKSMAIDRAIKKYGINNFDHWIITIVDTDEQANQEEIFWIAEMRYYLGKKMVYNISDGGLGGAMRGRKHSQKTLQKMSESQQRNIKDGKYIGFKKGNKYCRTFGHTGKKHSDETKKKCAHGKGKTWKLINGKRVWMEV